MTPEELTTEIEQALAGGFFVARGHRLYVSCEPRREVSWELLGGHLLDAAMTREVEIFATWEVSLAAGEDVPRPFLAILWDEPGERVYVVRYLRVHGFEAYEAEPRVILTRPVEKVARELVGTIYLVAGDVPAEVRSRLEQLLFRALVGTRLPVTSWESPLPEFQWGRCTYLPGLRCPDGTDSWGERSNLPEQSWGRHSCLPDGIAAKDAYSALPAETTVEQLVRFSVSAQQPLIVRAKALEAALRSADNHEATRFADMLADAEAKHSESDAVRGGLRPLLAALFQRVALTPYTVFGERLVCLLRQLAGDARVGPETIVDIISLMLRHLVRHLTAFDLRTFHNRGANYPDLLFLDGLLKAYLSLAEEHPQLFYDGANNRGEAQASARRRRRRALRQAWLTRQQHEGLKVPSRPSSPGDLQRVSPALESWALAGVTLAERVPAEAEREDDAAATTGRDERGRSAELLHAELQQEVDDPAKRRWRLFAEDPLEEHSTLGVRALLEASISDLDHDAELRELGLATFLDRPLGQGKPPGAVDRSPLLTYEAFSRGIARQRLAAWCRAGRLSTERRDELTRRLDALAPAGFRGHQGQLPQRPGVPCLEDANLAEPDFVYLRVTRSSLDEFLGHFDWREMQAAMPRDYAWLTNDRHVLLIRSNCGRDAPFPEMNAGKVANDERTGPSISGHGVTGPQVIVAIDSVGQVRFRLRLAARGAKSCTLIEWEGCEIPPDGLLAQPVVDAASEAGSAPAIAVPWKQAAALARSSSASC